MSTGEVQVDIEGLVYPWYTRWPGAQFWRGRDSCPSIVYSVLHSSVKTQSVEETGEVRPANDTEARARVAY